MINKYRIKIRDIEFSLAAENVYRAYLVLENTLKTDYFQMPRSVIMNGALQTKDWVTRSWERYSQYKVHHSFQ